MQNTSQNRGFIRFYALSHVYTVALSCGFTFSDSVSGNRFHGRNRSGGNGGSAHGAGTAAGAGSHHSAVARAAVIHDGNVAGIARRVADSLIFFKRRPSA